MAVNGDVSYRCLLHIVRDLAFEMVVLYMFVARQCTIARRPMWRGRLPVWASVRLFCTQRCLCVNLYRSYKHCICRYLFFMRVVGGAAALLSSAFLCCAVVVGVCAACLLFFAQPAFW